MTEIDSDFGDGWQAGAEPCPRCFRPTEPVQVGRAVWRYCAPCGVHWLDAHGLADQPASAEADQAGAALLALSRRIRPPGSGPDD